MSYQVGTELKRSNYRILGLVGQGQFGRVFCAVNRQTGRLVALKNLEQQRFPTHKFLRELRFLISLQHPNIVTFHALEHNRTGRYLVMDYCEGGTLRNLMEADYRLSLSQSIKLITDVLAGLEHAHARGVIHLDIKPENILLSLQPTGWVARISDFGIAKFTQGLSEEDMGGNTGSPAYMAPERFYGQYSKSSDVYSVGIMLFELLTGYRPFSGTPLDLMSAHLNNPLRIPDTVPEMWRPLLLTSLQKLAARRFRSASEMLAEIRRITAEEATQAMLLNSQLPLLKPINAPAECAFHAAHQDILSHPVTSLAIADLHRDGRWLEPTHPGAGTYWSESNRLVVAPLHLDTASNAPAIVDSPYALNVASPVQSILLRPQGCFVIAQDGVHRISTVQRASSTLTTQRIAELEEAYVADIEARGRWLATATLDAASQHSVLKFWPLDSLHSPVGLAHDPVPLAIRCRDCSIVTHVIALDARHVAAVIRISTKGKRSEGRYPATLFEIFARRGNRLGSLTVPLTLTNLVKTLTPYRLLATDEYDPHSVLLVDLKPYRVSRIGVSIVPKLLTATSWGYILVDQEGRIVLLDDCGQQVNQIVGPADPTAIASVDHHGLFIATWNGTEGQLHTVDLRQLETDLLF